MKCITGWQTACIIYLLFRAVKHANCVLAPQVAGYAELIRTLGELHTAGEKGHRQLLTAILPHIALYETLPASLVPQVRILSAEMYPL